MPAKRIIAYAPSIGYSDPQLLEKAECAQGIKKLTKVFARDDKTAQLAQTLRNEEIERVCDPTLLIADQWKNLEEEYKIDTPYIMVYSYHPDPKVKEEVCNYAKKNGLKIMRIM